MRMPDFGITTLMEPLLYLAACHTSFQRARFPWLT